MDLNSQPLTRCMRYGYKNSFNFNKLTSHSAYTNRCASCRKINLLFMLKYILIFILVFGFSCANKESDFITIINIGHTNRIGIANQLKVLNQSSPRVIGLDILLVNDSLDIDTSLSNEIKRSKSLVVGFNLKNEFFNHMWDTLEQNHPKFKNWVGGYLNLSTTDDNVLINELPLRQYYKDSIVCAFSYSVAYSYDLSKLNSEFKNGFYYQTFSKRIFKRKFKIINGKELISNNFNMHDLKDKIVLMGYIGKDEDYYYLDDDKSFGINGVQVHASIIEQLLK
jgi:hypothetical protein